MNILHMQLCIFVTKCHFSLFLNIRMLFPHFVAIEFGKVAPFSTSFRYFVGLNSVHLKVQISDRWKKEQRNVWKQFWQCLFPRVKCNILLFLQDLIGNLFPPHFNCYYATFFGSMENFRLLFHFSLNFKIASYFIVNVFHFISSTISNFSHFCFAFLPYTGIHTKMQYMWQ